MARRGEASEALTAELEALQGLSRAELKRRWRSLYGSPCPGRIGRVLLIRALAYRIQEEALEGLNRPTRRRLERAARNIAAGRTPGRLTSKIKPGTRLLREWQGVVHEVIVLERCVEYRGKSWPSLSAVAREITGARWSGPRFFGLKAAPSGRG